jgi:TonB family protein
VVLTCSDELLEQVGLALDGTGEVRHAENEEDARQLADARHATVMLIDAREQVDPGLVVERLHASDGSTVIVVFAPADVMADVARVIKGSAAFAVLPIPIEQDKTRAVLLGAGEEALARRAMIAAAATAAPVATGPELEPRSAGRVPELKVVDLKSPAVRADEPSGSRVPAPPAASAGTPRASRRPGVIGLAVACLLLAVAAAWLYLRDTSESSRPVARETGPQLGPALSMVPQDELLDRARVAFHERRYTEPDRDNALYYYQSVLARAPGDAEAREGLERIGAILDGRLESALAARRLDDAARSVEQLRSIRPGDTALAAAGAQLAEQRVAAALARADAEQANRLLNEAVAAGVAAERLAPLRDQLARLDASQSAAQLSRLIRARIRDGKLLSPPGDSARYHLGQLLKLPNGDRLGADLRTELGLAFADSAERAAEEGQGDQAARWLAEARALGYVPEPRPVEASAATAATTVAPAGAAAPRALEPPVAMRAAVPAETTAAVAVPAEPGPSAADFRRTRYVAPVYPTQALARGQSGEVRVRITVGTDGRVSDVQLVAASPPGVFDQAAVSAVRKWRFEPVLKQGRAIEASVVTSIRFEPDDAARR